MENLDTQASLSTPKSDEQHTQFTVSVYDRNRGWTDNRPLHRRAQSVRIQVLGFDTYVYVSEVGGVQRLGVRVMDRASVRSHFIAGATPKEDLSTDAAEIFACRGEDEDESDLSEDGN